MEAASVGPEGGLTSPSPKKLPRVDQSNNFSYTLRILQRLYQGLCHSHLPRPQDKDRKLSAVRCSKDESHTSKEPNYPTAGVVIRTSLETHCFCSQQPAAPDPISEHEMLYRFPSGSLLDP